MSGNDEQRVKGVGGNGCSPHFQRDFLEDHDRGENGGSPQIRVSTRARRLSVRVHPDARVEVVVPKRVRPSDVEQFLSAHREWIETRREAALRNRPVPEPFPPPAITFVAAGERWRLHLAGGTERLAIRELGEDADQFRVLRVSGVSASSGLRNALRAWLLRAARERLEPRVAALSAATGIEYSRVSIRRQRSRWGSCSVSGTISLNACLLFQRPEVVDYLVIHELTHVKHMNHSARFWAAVETHCPDWRRLDRELVQGWRHVPRWVFSDE
jgi:predicted metal-dependent hydrolase